MRQQSGLGRSQFPPLSRSPGTRQTYEKKGAKIALQMSALAGSKDLSSVVAQFLVTGSAYSQRTFRLYKASLLQHLTTLGAPPSLLKLLADASSKDCAKRSDRTSGRKAKSVAAEDRVLLLAAMRGRRGDTAQTAADYFEAGLIAGPRPVEWIGASLASLRSAPIDAPVGATHTLTFRNAKRDEDGVRGNGDTRTLYLTLAAVEAAVIARVIENADRNQADWGAHYARLRGALRYAGKRLWPKRKKVPSFYTTRHQAQADAKASGTAPNSIAAMFGHASDNTASQHYARASQGDKNMYKIAPTAVSLARVRSQRATQRVLERPRRVGRPNKEPGKRT